MLKNIENQTSPLAPGNKRSADVMLDQYGNSPLISPSRETVASDNQSDTENYALKRPRTSSNGGDLILEKIPPSRVLHVRNLPPDTSETEIMGLAGKFGSVTNMILMRNKRQAFVEMGDIHNAMELIRHHQHPLQPALIRNIPVQLQYSAAYTELQPGQRSHANGMKSTPVLHVNIDNLSIPVTLNVLHQIFSRCGTVEKIITFTKNNQFQSLIQFADVNAAQIAKQMLDGKNIYPNCCILRIDFSKMLSVNVRYNNDKSRDFTNPDLPSSDDALPHPPRSCLPRIMNSATPASRPLGMMPYGATGAAMPSSQMMNPLTAAGLAGMRMIGAANSAGLPTGLSIPTSASQELPQSMLPHQMQSQIRQQLPGQQMISSTRLPEPTQQLTTSPQMKSTLQQQLQLQQLLLSQLQGSPITAGQLTQLPPVNPANQFNMYGQPTLPMHLQAQQYQTQHQLQPQQLQSQQLLTQAKPLTVPSTQPHQLMTATPHQQAPNQYHQQLIAAQIQAQQMAASQFSYLPQYQAATNTIKPEHQNTVSAQIQPPVSRSPAVSTSPDIHSTPSPGVPGNGSPVVLVTSLNPQKVSPDALFTLFGMYGDVLRVKICYHKPDTAMVQFATHSMAMTACEYLDRAVFFGQEVRVMISKHHSIQLPHHDKPDGRQLTKDYSSSNLHRYQKLDSKNLRNIYPPSTTLHLSNIPYDISEDSPVFSEFSKYGKVTGFKFFDKDKRMALIEMSSVTEAIEAMIAMHNYEINPTSHLRVSFSKSKI